MASKTPRADIHEIKDGDTVLAIVYPKGLRADGVRFLTPNEYPLQIGLLEHREGKHVEMHQHPKMPYDVRTTQEFLYVEKGTIKVAIATRDWNVVETVTLSDGDFILFVDGAHELEIDKGSRLIEIKQGPYPGDAAAKVRK